MAGYKKYAVFKGRMLIVGFGSVGQGSLPLILRHIDINPEQITIITANAFGREIAGTLGVKFIVDVPQYQRQRALAHGSETHDEHSSLERRVFFMAGHFFLCSWSVRAAIAARGARYRRS